MLRAVTGNKLIGVSKVYVIKEFAASEEKDSHFTKASFICFKWLFNFD
jgi:hypothetical protein